MTMITKFENASDAFSFMMAGNSIVTFKSLLTGKHFAYNVKKPKGKDVFFVSVVHRQNDKSDFSNKSYLGMISNFSASGLSGNFVTTKKSAYSCEAIETKAFAFAFKKLQEGSLSPMMEVYHSGTCGRCNRLLTDPESIKRGIGPECIKHIGGK